MDSPAAHAFDSAARWFLEVAGSATGHYDAPGLGEWSVRDLLGHTSRSLSTVETYLDVASADAGPVELADAVAYYLAIAGALADTAATVQRGRAAGAALGEDPMAALRALVARVPELVRAAPANALVRTAFGTMTLEGYLPTRTLELTVHTCDLAAALGVSAEVPQRAVAEAFAVIGGLAAAQGTASAALLALTGRLALPADYSVL
ncbi:MAG: maleylpyruvate isomerase N-terminal domain-containing protein [Actinomycetota bacterium]|nr:maleylpyruvate isomerase N-terminal domain-containing protein [Actinomycetota bacterium]